MLEFSVRKRDLAWAVALLMVVTTIWVARGDQADAGGNGLVPPGTGIDVVYVAVGTNFPDSLGSGPGGGVNNAPVIILPTNPPIPDASADELKRLDPKKVVIVGGTAVISTSMENAIEDLLPNATVERIGGADRYETNAMFSESVFPVESWVAVAASAFTADDPHDDEVVMGSAVYNVSPGSLFASISLPHGAEILELKALGINNLGSTLTVTLRRASESSSSDIATATDNTSSGDTSFSTTDIEASQRFVDNENNVYFIRVSITDADRQIYGVMVRYRLGTPGV